MIVSTSMWLTIAYVTGFGSYLELLIYFDSPFLKQENVYDYPTNVILSYFVGGELLI